jgi:hypothetical protein
MRTTQTVARACLWVVAALGCGPKGPSSASEPAEVAPQRANEGERSNEGEHPPIDAQAKATADPSHDDESPPHEATQEPPSDGLCPPARKAARFVDCQPGQIFARDCCFDDFDSACRAMQCPAERCRLMRSSPGQASCAEQ